MKNLVPAFLVSLLTTCSMQESVIEDLSLESMHLYIYDCGRAGHPYCLVLDDDGIARFRRWLRELSRNATMDFNTYAPSLIVYGEQFTVNFHKNRTIIGVASMDKKYSMQYSRRTTVEDNLIMNWVRDTAPLASPRAVSNPKAP